ncbi:MAG TPA: hypothetical protein VN937_21415 [Blastocatellia bacterium]|nr:hypothetical protein [Blastocatellia bacterium]
MASNIYWLEGPWRGRLAIIPRPRGGDWLRDEVSDWGKAGIGVVASLLTPDEVAELDLEAEKEICEANEIRFVGFAIPDRGVPASNAAASTLVHDLEESLAKGETVAVHCRQSVGRSAMIAAYLMVITGEDARVAFRRISSARGRSVPDTPDQERWVLERDLEQMRTKGERLFERYLRLQGITDYEYESKNAGKLKRPDYTVVIADQEYLFEVKDFQPKDALNSASDPYIRIRKRIELAREKFREYKDWPCCLVLYDDNARLDLEEPEIMLGAMYGNFGVGMEFNHAIGELDAATERWGFHDGGKMFRPKSSTPQNTTISAVITLRHVAVGLRKLGVFLEGLKEKRPNITAAEALSETFSRNIDFDKQERHLGVIVWENEFARIPFPRTLFCGPYDLRWGKCEKEMEIGKVIVGSEIAALEDLEKPGALQRKIS